MTRCDRTRRMLVSVAAMLAGVCSPSGPVRAQAPAAPPTLVLLANQPAFGPGAGLSVTLGLQHTGAAVAADLYFGAILPDGDSVVFFEGLGLASRQGRLSDLSSLRPLIPGLAIATGTNIVVPDFFRYTWQGNEPPGTYQLFFAATVPGALRDGQVGAGDILAIETQSILNLPPATVTTDPGRAGSAVVGAAGGAVTASAGDGTLYTLNVPEGALAVDTTITLTPLTGLAGLPVPVTLAAGVRGEPSGLRFTRPATLVVELPQPLEGDVFGMPMPDSGAGFDLQPVARSGNRLQMPVEHFSVVAIPRTDAELAALIAPTSAYAQAIQLGTVALPGNPADVQALLAFMTAWYDTEIQPMFGGRNWTSLRRDATGRACPVRAMGRTARGDGNRLRRCLPGGRRAHGARDGGPASRPHDPDGRLPLLERAMHGQRRRGRRPAEHGRSRGRLRHPRRVLPDDALRHAG
ncbi:MAG: hypothetical protein AB7H81_06515 [Vicinamibacterales bacterium]